jgi:hypothetical protein
MTPTEIEALGDERGWRLIESAPNFWIKFLAWCPSTGLVLMEKHDSESRTWSLSGNPKNPEPTHWQPLPTPPTGAE